MTLGKLPKQDKPSLLSRAFPRLAKARLRGRYTACREAPPRLSVGTLKPWVTSTLWLPTRLLPAHGKQSPPPEQGEMAGVRPRAKRLAH